MFYLITVDDNDPEEIISVLAEQGLEAKVGGDCVTVFACFVQVVIDDL